ncbi:MAG: LysM peptidoglycan-binding domain-containing protein [Cyclobacteriaceae bacterium]|nr:LysM peptidoglycan-binding domain-containing protein [Cyclobacteriaceae bacterium]
MFQLMLVALLGLSPGDSLRMEMINGKPHVVHQVGEKETLYSLSKRYGTTVADILVQNPTADAGLEVGQILKIPYGGKVKTGAAVKTSDGIVHRVAAKETLFSIARHYNVSVDDIRTWNNLKDGSIAIGQDILIRQKTETSPVVTESKPAPTGAKTHTVASKETLYSIARTYGMTVTQLKEWNNMADNELKIGQVLTVAAPSVAAAPVGATPAGTTPTSTTTTPVSTPAVIPATTPTASTTTSSVTVSESLNGSSEAKETGMAALLEGTESNRKYLAQHRTIKPGTILKIRNLATNQEVFVRVTGAPTTADDGTIIFISRSAFDRLGASENKFRAEITFYK